MTTIRQQDFIQSIADAFQFISFYHPVDFPARWSRASRFSRAWCKDMPVTVAVDAGGNLVHESGPREWRAKIGKIPVTMA